MVCLFWRVHGCEIQCKSLDNPHEFSQFMHCGKEDELFYENI